MITVSWHLLLFVVVEIALMVVGLLSASKERGMMAGIGCLPYLLVAVGLLLFYGGVFLW